MPFSAISKKIIESERSGSRTRQSYAKPCEKCRARIPRTVEKH